MEPDRSLPRGRVVAFPSPAERPPGPTAGQLPEILPTARRLSRASWPPAGRTDEVSDRIAVGVVASGVVLCTIGTLVTPTVSVADADLSLFAQLLATVFWGGALLGAVGLFYRRRRGVVGALVAALAFLSAPITAAILDHAVVGRMWFAEVVCALEFLLVCLAALRSTRRRSDHIGTNGLDRGSDSGTNHTHHAKT